MKSKTFVHVSRISNKVWMKHFILLFFLFISDCFDRGHLSFDIKIRLLHMFGAIMCGSQVKIGYFMSFNAVISLIHATTVIGVGWWCVKLLSRIFRGSTRKKPPTCRKSLKKLVKQDKQSSRWAPVLRPKTSKLCSNHRFFSFYLELYKYKFKNLIRTSKLKFSFRGLDKYNEQNVAQMKQ